VHAVDSQRLPDPGSTPVQLSTTGKSERDSQVPVTRPLVLLRAERLTCRQQRPSVTAEAGSCVRIAPLLRSA